MWKMLDEKTRGQKSRETLSLSGAKSNIKQKGLHRCAVIVSITEVGHLLVSQQRE
jgi:hypothetical protein